MEIREAPIPSLMFSSCLGDVSSSSPDFSVLEPPPSPEPVLHPTLQALELREASFGVDAALSQAC